MKSILLKAQKRDVVGKAASRIREKGLIPAVVYGHKIKNINIQVASNEFMKVYREAGESTLFDLSLNDASPVKVIIQDVQKDPVKGDFIHVDFHQVSMKEKLQTQIPLKFVGVAPAVKAFGGVFVTQKESINVKCLPQDLVSEIEVDVTPMVTLEDSLRIKDLRVSEKIEVLDNPQDIVASVIVTKEEVIEVKPAETVTEAGAATAEKKEGEGAPDKGQAAGEKSESKKAEAKKTEAKK